jgi:hypothetical protein
LSLENSNAIAFVRNRGDVFLVKVGVLVAGRGGNGKTHSDILAWLRL